MKAKDLLKQTSEENQEKEEEMADKPQDKPDEHERVNEAYESLSKKLAAIREGKKPEESDESEKSDDSEELEEDVLEDEEGLKNDEDNDEDEKEKPESGKIEELDKDDMKDEEEMKTDEEISEEEPADEPKKTFIKPEKETPDPLDEADNLTEKEVKEANALELDEPMLESEKPAEVETVERDLGDLAEVNKEEVEHKTISEMGSNYEEEEEAVHIPQLGQNRPTSTHRMFQKNSNEDSQGPPSTQHHDRNMFSPRFGAERKRGASKWHVLILLLIGLAVIGGTVYLLKGGLSFAPSPTPTPTPTPEVTPTPTPTPEPIDRAQFKVRVLNGTETSGLAKTQADKLKALGYQIEKTGNATNSAFLKTVVRVKENQASLSGQLVTDLAPDLSADVVVDLKSSDAADAEVILGEK